VDEVVVLDREAGLLLPDELRVQAEPFVEHGEVHVDPVVAGVEEAQVDVLVLVVLGAAHDVGIVGADVHAGKGLAAERDVVEVLAGDVRLGQHAVLRAVVHAGDGQAHAAAFDGEVGQA